MAKKKFNMEEIKDVNGPMNSVSKDDALYWAGAPDVKHISQLEPKLKREVLAKKSKAVKSSKKAERNASKQILKNLDRK
jgi:hypothetical protein